MKLLLGLAVFAATALAQAPPEFEAATIRRSVSPTAEKAIQFTPGGQFTAHNVTVGEFVPLAFRTRPGSIENLPGWVETMRVDVGAKAPSQTGELELGLMLRTLFIRDLNLKWHMETRPRDGYALVLAPGRAKLQKAAAVGPPLCQRGRDLVECTNLTLADLAERLPLWAPAEIDRTILDQTGIQGTFDVRLEWVPLRSVDTTGGLTIFDALIKELGLRLVPRKLPLPVVVIDNLDLPPAN